MYTQINKAGVKHYLLLLLLTAVTGTLLSYLKVVFSSRMVVEVITIAVFFTIGYFVFMRYCAVFEYATDANVLRLTRRIGRNVRTVEIEVRKIKKLTQDKAMAQPPKKSVNMCVSLLSKKNVYYAVYFENNVKKAVLFEPSKEFIQHMKGKGTKV